jgi:hypothetical protein
VTSAATPAADEAAGRPSGDLLRPGRRGRRGRRGLLIGLLAAILAAGGAAVAVTDPFAASRPSGPAGSGLATSLAAVTSGPLSSQTQVSATLGYTGSYAVVNQAMGTFTWLPSAGQVIRQGGVLYQVNGSPVILLYGRIPMYRNLAAGASGGDVRQLNDDLVALGYADSADIAALGWDYFSWETRYALERLQQRLGITQSGTLALGTAVMLPADVRITSISGTLGASAPPGQAVMQATSTSLGVTVPLNADLQTDVKTGDKVSVTLPDGATTPGVVSSVGTVATVNSDGTATISVQVTLSDPAAVRGLDQAPVQVTITTASVSNALSVPVDALLAQAVQGDEEAGGEYAVEVAGPGGSHRLVPVTVGLFDDAAGQVQVTGSGLSAGQQVVVPAL